MRKCTVLDATQRYANLDELLEDLDKYARDEPVGMAHPEFDGVACALGFEIQVTPRVPVGPLDRRIDMLVTDQKVRRFK